MKSYDRRNFLIKASLSGVAALSIPALGLGNIHKKNLSNIVDLQNLNISTGNLNNEGLRITGTFLDEISMDIPHQNWGEKEWDNDFRNMKAIGIDTVIMIRSGYRKFITYPSNYLMKKGCYKPSIDLLDLYLRLAEKYHMSFYFGLYDSGKYCDTGDLTW